MKFLLKALLVLVVLLALAAVGVYIYALGLRPQYSGEVEMASLNKDVEVLYDEYGIPHIYAQNASDAYFSLGYIHAQDRLFQMDLLRRVGSGRLSEFFGETTRGVDRLFRTLGIAESAKESAADFDELDPELKTAVQSYLNGVNHFAETGPVPLEYLIGGLPREPFTVEDVYSTAGYMAFSFAAALRTDPLVAQISEQLGAEYLKDLAVHHYPGEIVSPKGISTDSMPTITNDALAQLDQLALPIFTGSNNWVVAGSRTQSGKPIMANDTHIKYSQPSTWFEAHIEFPGNRLYGNFLAGIPLALIGHNERVSWGITMFQNDDIDFYFEEKHPEDSLKVRYKDNLWADVELNREIIRIKDSPNDTLWVQKTPHGPIVNEFINQTYNKPISMYWTYTRLPNELPEAFFALNRAQNINQARDAIKLIHAPGLNFSYADADNNIALWSAAHLIKRPAHVNSKLILNGATGHDDPLGFYSFEANPQVENPASGVVYSANSQHDTTAAGILYPGYYSADARMIRIAELLSKQEIWSVEEMKKVTPDNFSPHDAKLAKVLFSEIARSDDSELIEFFEPLNSWQGDHELESKTPVLYYPLLYHLLHHTFADELGEEQFANFLNTPLMKRTTYKVFNKMESVWFDDVSTADNRETKSDIVIAAAKSAFGQLKEQNPSGHFPTWGDVHTVTFEHPMGAVKPLDKIFNVGPFPIAGTNESLNQEGFQQNSSGVYPVQHGPQMRIIIDMAEPEQSISVNPTGQSGNPLSEFYSDQAALFVGEKYRPQLMNRKAIEQNTKHKLRLISTKQSR